MIGRKCIDCLLWLPMWAYHFARTIKYHSRHCRKCQSVRTMISRKKRQKHWLDYNKQWRINAKIDTFNHYSPTSIECACCHEKELQFLTLDHINGGGNKQRKLHGSGNSFYSWLKKNNWPSGFQVLCFNCNCAKGFFGRCPHAGV